MTFALSNSGSTFANKVLTFALNLRRVPIFLARLGGRNQKMKGFSPAFVARKQWLPRSLYSAQNKR